MNDDEVDCLLDEAETLDDIEAAMPLYERALVLAPDHAAVHCGLGLVYKYRGAWAESLRHNRRPSDLREGYEPANWNMGIAAKALRDWPAAREAWRRAGIEIADGAGPIEDDFGQTSATSRTPSRGSALATWCCTMAPRWASARPKAAPTTSSTCSNCSRPRPTAPAKWRCAPAMATTSPP